MTDHAGEYPYGRGSCQVSFRRPSNSQYSFGNSAEFPFSHEQSLRCQVNTFEKTNLIRSGIEDVVSRVFGVSRVELRKPTRGRADVALARQVSMYLAHVVFGLSLTEVGRAFDRDRTTVAHACGVVEDRRDDPTFDCILENLERIVEVWPATRELLKRLR